HAAWDGERHQRARQGGLPPAGARHRRLCGGPREPSVSAIRRIVILTHRQQGLDPDYYLGRCKRQVWELQGRTVLVHEGTADPPAADVGFLHVDLTVVPAAYAELAKRYPRCVNGAVTDISKRRISRWQVARDDAYDGPVIVKTNLNHLGHSEQRLRLADA